MKKNIFIQALSILAIGYGLTSCLDGDEMNTPPGGSPPIVEMSYLTTNGTNINSGLQFFTGQTLLLSPAKAADTLTFAATVQGTFSDDVNVTIHVNADAIDDSSDGVEYALMNETQYKLLSTTGTIKADKPYVEFQVIVYPPNIDFTKSVMLPITVTNDQDLTVSSNFGTVYFHIIGNPIAGLYTQQFIRVPDGGTSFTGRTSVFSPKDPTTISVPTGYYDGGPLLITFDNDGAGNLTNFKAVVDPAVVAGKWKDDGIQVTTDPTIQVNATYTEFTITYSVLGGSGARDCTDIFVKQ